LGLLEAEGGRWDGVWALGLSDEVLPASPKPNPLLPLAVLRAAGAPRATPERERQWADERYASLCACAPVVIASHPAMAGERSLRPAPLIAALPWHAAPPTAVPPAKERRPIHLEERNDTAGLPLSSNTATTGGLDVLETQARNPLWAYVRHRLGARALDDYAEVITASARGRFLHAALEALAAMLPDQARLHALAQDFTLNRVQDLTQNRLATLIKEATAQAAQATLADWPPVLRDLECARAHAIVADWLAFDAQRAPYAIAAVERTLRWQHGPLCLTLRVDRIDRLADGRLLVIDFKTGKRLPNPLADWLRARPVNLQLPFYAAVLSSRDALNKSSGQALLAGRDGLQGANHSHSRSYGEDLQRGRPPEAAGSAARALVQRIPDDEPVAALMLAQLHARAVSVAGVADGEAGAGDLADAAQLSDGQTWSALLAHWRGAITRLADEYAQGLAPNLTLRRDDLQYCDALPFLRLDDDSSESS